MTLFKLNTSVHKWLSLFVGLQLLIWLGTGLYFNLADHASGNDYRIHSKHQASAANFELIDLSSLASEPPVAVKLVWVLNDPYYQLIYEQGAHGYQKRRSMLFDAHTGQSFRLTKEHVLVLARNSYSGPGKLANPVFVEPPVADQIKQQNPLWQVTTNDEKNTTIYLDGITGRVLGHVNDDVRLKDLMMKLHFMDYGDSGGFNHWLIILFGIATLLLALTGVTWLIQHYQNGLLRLSWRHKQQNIAVTFVNEQTSADIVTPSNASILEGLASSQIHLPSSCGGGGTCGKCVFLSAKPLPITSSEQQHLTTEQLSQGHRLACQHQISDVSEIKINSQTSVDTHELVVVATDFVTPFIKQVKFKVKSGKQLSFIAGAYMQFEVPAGVNHLCPNDLPDNFKKYWQDYEDGQFSHDGATRHYSMVNFAEETDELIFNIRWQTALQGQNAGIGSSYLGALQVGESINATGPFCDFYASANQVDQRFFIGAGSGLAPLRAIITEQLKKYQYQGDITLIYGARSEDDLLYHQQLTQLAEQHSNFSYIPTLSSPSEAWQGHSGYVQKVLKTYLNQDCAPSCTEFYLCGPAAMMIEVEQIITAAGVPATQIFKDEFSR